MANIVKVLLYVNIDVVGNLRKNMETVCGSNLYVLRPISNCQNIKYTTGSPWLIAPKLNT